VNNRSFTEFQRVTETFISLPAQKIMVVYMKFKWVWVVTCVFFLQLSYTQWACSERNDTYEWTFIPKEEGRAHVEVTITLGEPDDWHLFTLPREYHVEIIRAYDVRTEEDIPYTITEEEDMKIVKFEFDSGREEEFQFSVEFNLENIVMETDEVYDFLWECTAYYKTSHSSTVILPERHELLSAEPLEFEIIHLDRDQTSVKFDKEVPELESFEFSVTFSKKGVELIEEGKEHEDRSAYREARSAYLQAITFYSKFPIINDEDKDDFLARLENRVKEINRNLQEPEESFRYVWTFEPKEDGSVHVEVTIELGSPCLSYWIILPKGHSEEIARAQETETERNIDHTRVEEKDKIRYVFEFEDEKEEGFQFSVEFNLENIVMETDGVTDGVYIFSWEWPAYHKTSHIVTIKLPEKHELLFVKSLNPMEFPSDQNQISVIFEEYIPEKERFKFKFEFKVIFSRNGVDLIEKAESFFSEKKFHYAIWRYKDAIKFYSNSKFLRVNDQEKDDFLARLQNRVEEIEYIKGPFIYDWTFEIKEDLSVHVEVWITIGAPCFSYSFLFPEDYHVEDYYVENIEARDMDGNTFTYSEEKDKKRYIFDFGEEKDMGFVFFVKFVLKDIVGKTDEVYTFPWEWTKDHVTNHKARVFIPEGYDLLSPEVVIYDELPPDQDQIYYDFEETVSVSKPFRFKVTFGEPPLPPWYIYLGVFLAFLILLVIIIQRSIFKSITNPYIVGPPIKSKNMFFGREDVFQFIKNRLSAVERNIVLHGERRTGKTSILLQIKNGRLGKKFVPVYIDLQEMAGVNDREFCAKVTDKIMESLVTSKVLEPKSHDYSEIHEIIKEYKPELNPYNVFTDFLDKASDVLEKKYLLVMFDEYERLWEKVKSKDLSPDLIQYLRYQMQFRDRFAFIFTGSKKLKELKGTDWSVMFNVAIYKRISFLERGDALALMSDPVKNKIQYEGEAMDKLLRLTAYHPYFLQLFLQNLVDLVNDNRNNHVTVEEITLVLDYILRNPQSHMSYVWEDSTPEQRMVLSALSEIIESEDQYITAKEIRKKLLENEVILSEKTIEKACDGLANKEILGCKKRKAAYNFKIDLFRFWIENEYPVFKFKEEKE